MKKVLINAVGLDRSSGGYKSYFTHVILEILNQDNEANGVSFFVLLSDEAISKYGTKINPNQIISAGDVPVGWRRFLWEKREVHKIIERESISLLYTPYQIGPVNISNCVCVLMFRNMEPFVAKDYSYPIANRVRSYVLRYLTVRLVPRADAVISISKFTDSFISKKITCKRAKLIPHGINQPSAGERVEVNGQQKVLFTAGSILPYRRIEDILNALPIVKQMFPNVKLFIAGNGNDPIYWDKLQSLVIDLNLQSNVVFLGRISKEQMERSFRRSAVFIMSSEVEACPNTALEAMSYGCAIVSSENQPMPEFFENAALYYNRRDKVGLAEQVLNILNSTSTQKMISKRAVIQSQKFGWDKTIRHTKQFLEQLINEQ